MFDILESEVVGVDLIGRPFEYDPTWDRCSFRLAEFNLNSGRDGTG